MEKVNEKRVIEFYDRLYSSGKSFREEWEGRLSLEYKVPKYTEEFFNIFGRRKGLSVLEIGAGDGLITKLIISRMKCKKYVATEPSKAGIRRLKSLGVEAKQMYAEDLRFTDNSFDVVCCFDVMHHVADPRKMAQEMLRVTRDSIFLVEASSFCIIRKLLEMTKKNRAAGENSYSPFTYKRFFAGSKEFRIKPFMFLFPNTPQILSKLAISISVILERWPLLKWQCGNLAIYVRK